MPRRIAVAALVLPAFLFPAAALAHTAGAGHEHSWVDGLLHPLTGVDHLAAMLGIGLWAAMRTGREMWFTPLGFVTGMAAGLLFGLPIGAGFVEGAIIVSLVTLGLLLALAVRLPAWACAAAAAAAGLVHGAAHASEAPPGFAGFAVAALVTTALLHAAGAISGATLGGRLRLVGPIAGLALGGVGVSLALQAM
jgi:urease accessory protein